MSNLTDYYELMENQFDDKYYAANKAKYYYENILL